MASPMDKTNNLEEHLKLLRLAIGEIDNEISQHKNEDLGDTEYYFVSRGRFGEQIEHTDSFVYTFRYSGGGREDAVSTLKKWKEDNKTHLKTRPRK